MVKLSSLIGGADVGGAATGSSVPAGGGTAWVVSPPVSNTQFRRPSASTSSSTTGSTSLTRSTSMRPVRSGAKATRTSSDLSRIMMGDDAPSMLARETSLAIRAGAGSMVILMLPLMTRSRPVAFLAWAWMSSLYWFQSIRPGPTSTPPTISTSRAPMTHKILFTVSTPASVEGYKGSARPGGNGLSGDSSVSSPSGQTEAGGAGRRRQPSTIMARKSLTLVKVGPVTTRSPRASKNE